MAPGSRKAGPHVAKKMNPTIESAVIDDRLPVWEALSDFFLDTELDEKDYQRISEVLASSPYTILDIEDILRFEIYPVLIWNLRSVLIRPANIFHHKAY